MPSCPTIKVVRKDHPDGYTEINVSDMTDKDVEYSENQMLGDDEVIEKLVSKVSKQKVKKKK